MKEGTCQRRKERRRESVCLVTVVLRSDLEGTEVRVKGETKQCFSETKPTNLYREDGDEATVVQGGEVIR